MPINLVPDQILAPFKHKRKMFDNLRKAIGARLVFEDENRPASVCILDYILAGLCKVIYLYVCIHKMSGYRVVTNYVSFFCCTECFIPVCAVL
jgi:hypothetical protein